MANMEYCRFENTYRDLRDCFDNFDDKNLDEDEKDARRGLLLLCQSIVSQYSIQDLIDLDSYSLEDEELET